jgi:hypothetical protein
MLDVVMVNFNMLDVIMLSLCCHYGELQYAEFQYAGCRYAEFHYAGHLFKKIYTYKVNGFNTGH